MGRKRQELSPEQITVKDLTGLKLPILINLFSKLEEHSKKRFPDEDSQKKFIKSIASYLNCKNLRKTLGGRKVTNITSDTNYNKLEIIRQLFLGFGIKPEEFHSELNLNHIYSLEYYHHSFHLKNFLYLEGKDDDPVKNFNERYCNALKPFISEAKKILIYEYLSYSKRFVDEENEEVIQNLRITEQDIYWQYEQKLLCKTNYSRFLAIPFPRYPKLINLKEGVLDVDSKLKYISKALRLCSAKAFVHVCNCLAISNKCFKLYIVYRPTRIYHYGIFEDVICTEYYRYKSEGDFIPNVLFIEDGFICGKETALFKIYDKELKYLKANEKRSFLLDITLFKDGLSLMQTKIIKKIDSLENQLRVKEISDQLRKKTNEKLRIAKINKKNINAKIDCYNSIHPDNKVDTRDIDSIESQLSLFEEDEDEKG